MRYAHSFALLLLALTGLACSGDDGDGTSSTTGTPPSTVDFIQMSYEAMPGTGTTVNYADDPYSERAAFTTKLEKELIPDIFTTIGVDQTKLSTEDVPGGYQLAVNPSIQTRAPEDWTAVSRTSAALGLVMLQWSVLLTDFTPSDAGNTGFAVVSFPAGTLDDKLANDFFAHAATVDAGLGGGFFSFADSMYFLNIADSQGMPYSGLTDADFTTKLGTAVGTFTGPKAEVSQSGKCDARFVENDWDGKPMGDEYWAKLSDLDQTHHDKLQALQDKFKMLFTDAVTMYGWDMPLKGPPSPQKPGGKYRGFWGYRFGQAAMR